MKIGLFVAASACLFAASAAHAGVYATQVESFSQGPNRTGGTIEAARSNPLLALGAPQNTNTVNFVSLGRGGELVVSFGTLFTGPAIITETTFPPIGNHIETAAIYVGVGNSLAGTQWYLAGSVVNTADAMPVDLTSASLAAGQSEFNYLRIVDTTAYATSASVDGFDVDGISVTAVPAPGAAMLAGLAGLAAARRRR